MVPTIGIVIYKIEVSAVIHSAEVSLSHGKADTVCKTLTKGTSGDLDAYIQTPVRMRDREGTGWYYHRCGVPLGGQGLTSQFV